MKKAFHCFLLVSLLCSAAFAQEFEIKKYDINAGVNPDERTIEVKAKLRLVNFSPPDLADRILLAPDNKPRLSFLLHSKAKVAALTINGAAVPTRTAEDARNNLLRVSTDITTTLAGLREFDAEFSYTLPAIDRSSSLHVSTSESFLLPASFWVPVVHTPYVEHGADTAPVSLTVTAPPGLKIVSAGIRKSDTTFEQTLAAQPFCFIGDYDVVARGGEARAVEVYAPRGLNQIGQQQTQRIAAEAERIIAFYVKYFGVPAAIPFRVISSQARQLGAATTVDLAQTRDVAFSTVGAVALDDSVFRRDALDLGTIELLAQAAARAWIDGRVLLRGRGTGVLRDALPVYLTAQYLGERFGAAQRDAAFERYRRAYVGVARTDAPLLMQSQLDRGYTSSVYNKGALVWRLSEKQLGQAAFDNLLRAMLDRRRLDVLSLSEWKGAPLCAVSRCGHVKALMVEAGGNRQLVNDLFTQWIENLSLPDFVTGQPQNTANGVESTVANFGTGDFTVEVVATTDKGERLRRNVTIKGGEYGAAVFPAGTNIKSVEADPDKLFIQQDYRNDAFPRPVSAADSFAQANTAFSKNDFAAAEAKAREALTIDPAAATLQSLLGRAQFAQNKLAEATQTFAAVLKSEPLPLQAYALAHLGLGDLLLQQNNAAEAAQHYRLASYAELDAATTIAARDGALKAEQATNAVKLSDELRGFIKQLDAALLQSTGDAINPFIELGNLRAFAQRVTIRKPAVWTTEVLRSEEWDANRTAIDVTLKVKIDNKDFAGRALYVVSRAGGKLRLSEVPIFDVK